MSFYDLHFRRLFIFVALSMLFSATTGQVVNNDSLSSSSDLHDVFNRTVVLNSASEHFLDMIFHEYSENVTEKISIARFKDLLKDLNLGNVSVKEKTSKQFPQAAHRRHRRRSSSYEGESSQFTASEFSGQRNRQRRRSMENTEEEEGKSQSYSVSNGSPARPRRRERRSSNDRKDSHQEHIEVRYSVAIINCFYYYFSEKSYF